MFNLTHEQHSKILGYSLAGFGVSTLFTYLGIIWILTYSKSGSIQISGAEVPFFVPMLVFGLSVWSGLIILSEKFRDFLNIEGQTASIVFVFVGFTSVPIGALLSFYVLVYLFKIVPESSKNEDNIDSGGRTIPERTPTK